MKRLLALTLLALFSAAPASAVCVPLWSSAKTNRLPMEHVASGDFTGDQRPDFVSHTLTGAYFAKTDATTGLAPAVNVAAEGEYFNSIAVLDGQGDGKLDFLITDIALNTLVFVPGNGDGTFGNAVVTPTGVSPSSVAVGDYTGDGKADVAFRSYGTSTLEVWRGEGNGSFTRVFGVATRYGSFAIAGGDFDGDGLLDAIISYSQTGAADVYFGNGDGTFDAAVPISVPNYVFTFAVADLDGDDDDDIVTADARAGTMSVLRSGSLRTFQITSHDVRATETDQTFAIDVVIGDVNDDGHLDVVAGDAWGGHVATFPGRGDGTFGEPRFAGTGWYQPYSTSIRPDELFLADYDLDGKLELLGADDYLSLAVRYENNCGEVIVSGGVAARVVSVGQTARMYAYVSTPPYHALQDAPVPSGTVTLFEGTTPIATATLGPDQFSFGPTRSRATFDVSTLAAGTHELHFVYNGSDEFHTAQSETFQQIVTTVKTNVSILNDTSQPILYGLPLTLTIKAVTTDGQQPTGPAHLIVNGVQEDYPFSFDAGSATRYVSAMPVGTKTVQVKFLGSNTHPPAISPVYTFTVIKAPTTLFPYSPPSPVRHGSTQELQFQLESPSQQMVTGTITLMEGSAVLATSAGSSYTRSVTVPVLPIGKHYLRAVYAGNENFLGSQSDVFEYLVLPNQPVAIDAAVISPGSVAVTWLANNSGYVRVERLVNGAWQWVGGEYWAGEARQVYNNIPAGVQLFRAILYDYSRVPVATSNVDVVVMTTFPDDPLVSGMTIKSSHVATLVDAINQLRAASGLSAITVNAAAGALMRASDLNLMRSALNQGREAVGAAPVTFTDGLVERSTSIKATHITQLRDAVR